ncbi:MAG: helix-turn-helix transcriptional regulator [Thermoleophilaceae bacterium]|nr:helix-turn-helix transcriptional regulator [Thermoleophilaceae bacterium]
MNTATKRSYAMGARAEAAAATGERILDAAEELFWSKPLDAISLDEVAGRAGVTVQTVIRRFGGKEGVIAAAAERARERVSAQRATAPVGDVPGAVAVLVDHYEAVGDQALRLLSDEDSSPELKDMVEQGRELHRQWCRRVFAPTLSGLSGVDHARREAQLVAACDVYTWKLLRRDAGLSRKQTELALTELIEPLTKGR